MHEQSAAARARWLAEMSAALEQAGGLVRLVRNAESDDSQSLELIKRIDAARRAIRALQLGGQRMPVDFPPEWTHPSGSEASISEVG